MPESPDPFCTMLKEFISHDKINVFIAEQLQNTRNHTHTLTNYTHKDSTTQRV